MPTLRPQRRAELLRYIRSYRRANGWAPTMEEMGVYLGIGVTGVGHWLRRMEREGLLAHLPHQARTYRPTLKGLALLAAEQQEQQSA